MSDYVFITPYMGMPPCGFLHSDISGSYGCTRLPGAFRSVPRPSSALDAWAFTVRPCNLSSAVAEKSTLSRTQFLRCVALFAMQLVKCVVAACVGLFTPSTPLTVRFGFPPEQLGNPFCYRAAASDNPTRSSLASVSKASQPLLVPSRPAEKSILT